VNSPKSRRLLPLGDSEIDFEKYIDLAKLYNFRAVL
jgi:hypothetical protein